MWPKAPEAYENSPEIGKRTKPSPTEICGFISVDPNKLNWFNDSEDWKFAAILRLLLLVFDNNNDWNELF